MSFLRSFFLFLVLTALLLPLPSSESFARRQVDLPHTQPSYQRAFAEIDSGRFQMAARFAESNTDPILSKVLRGILMAQPGNDYSFASLAAFVTENPGWPGLNGILMIAEQKIPPAATSDQVVRWFGAHPPQTLSGFYRYIDAMDSSNQSGVDRIVRNYWISHDFSSDELSAFHARYAPLLTTADHKARLDRLLWANNVTDARLMYPFINEGMKDLAEARIALANQLNNAESFVTRVPSNLRNDPGLLYERLRWRRKNNMDDDALEILTNAPENLGKPEKWWDERNILIRRMIERYDFKQAYRLAADHGLSRGADYIDAEFLSGWLALRFLNRADLAVEHFKDLLDSASTPVSRARGAYWLGRALEALGNKNEARAFYETAAALNTTFYGQLATTRLYESPVISAAPEPAIPESVRNKFFARDLIQATKRLYKIGQTDRARLFFRAVTTAANQRVEFALLMELAYQLQRPDWAINAAKAANQKNMIVTASAYPVLNISMPTPPDPAFTHALIRQESLFNADASSSAGARGLMQLMPRTAQEIARKSGMVYRESSLNDPTYNLRLGTAFIQEQINQFEGSYILALAGYNAGPRRVKEWLNLFGDPRTARTDPIDWIELIPIYETRNYVQRIMENLQFYRARLNGSRAPLTIAQDLKR